MFQEEPKLVGVVWSEAGGVTKDQLLQMGSSVFLRKETERYCF